MADSSTVIRDRRVARFGVVASAVIFLRAFVLVVLGAGVKSSSSSSCCWRGGVSSSDDSTTTLRRVAARRVRCGEAEDILVESAPENNSWSEKSCQAVWKSSEYVG
jgi:hypothetical protein